MIPARTAVLALVSGAGAALAVRLPEMGPWTLAALSVGAGVGLAVLSTRRPDAAAVPAGAVAGVVLVLPLSPWIVGAAFATLAWIPRARRAATVVDALSVLAFAAGGGAAAPILAGFDFPAPALTAAAALLAGVALAMPSFVSEASDECIALRRAARGPNRSANVALVRSAGLVERIARSDAPPALRERAFDLAGVLAEDGRALVRLGELGAGPAVDERRIDLEARIGRLAGVLERAWLTGDVPPRAPRLRVARELEEEADATERAHEAVARMGYD